VALASLGLFSFIPLVSLKLMTAKTKNPLEKLKSKKTHSSPSSTSLLPLKLISTHRKNH